MRPSRHTVPVNLVAGDAPALVVGYGKVGQRKTGFLRDCGVRVTVVSPDVSICNADGVEFVCREFTPGDCVGKMLVFACTDDKHVNRRILDDARRCGVPCCCADMNWANGDFVTPAVVRTGGATVAISTNGASCSGAKALRRSIGEFLELELKSRIVVVGTDDRLLPSDRRAACHLSCEAQRETAHMIYGIKGVDGLVMLSTCSRVEAIVHGNVDVAFVRRMMGFHGLDESEYFVLEGADAFRHLVRVASGLESAWAGEFHVVRQIKDALDESASSGMLCGSLKGFFDDVLRTSKDVRHATADVLDVKEIEATAVGYIASKLDISSARIAVLGAGTLGTSVAALLKGCNVTMLHHGDAVPECDALVCALAADRPVVTAAVPGRIVVDLGMPPNCSPDVGAVSLDALKDWRRAETGSVGDAIARADAVIAEALCEMERNGHGFLRQKCDLV